MIFFRTILSFLLDKGYRDLLITTAIVLTVGTIGYHFIEGWRWLDCFYFCITTLSTVAYGDFAPKTDLGKIFLAKKLKNRMTFPVIYRIKKIMGIILIICGVFLILKGFIPEEKLDTLIQSNP